MISENSRIIRNLLLKGANRDIKDFNNMTPYDLALSQKKYKFLAMLKQPNHCAEFSLKPPLRPPRPAYGSVLSFLLFYGCGNLLNILINVQYAFPIAGSMYIVLYVTAIALFLLTMTKSPGVLKGDSTVSLYVIFT